MTIKQLGKELIESAKGLSKETLKDVINYMRLMQIKESEPTDSLMADLHHLSKSETTHLEKEFEDYKKLYPSE